MAFLCLFTAQTFSQVVECPSSNATKDGTRRILQLSGEEGLGELNLYIYAIGSLSMYVK